MQSIDRKLARLAREIASAKPKGLSFEAFERDAHDFIKTPPREGVAISVYHITESDCRQIKGAAQASNTATHKQEQVQAAAPPIPQEAVPPTARMWRGKVTGNLYRLASHATGADKSTDGGKVWAPCGMRHDENTFARVNIYEVVS